MSMMQRFTFPVKLTKQKEGGFLVEFVDLPEAITQGESEKDALIEALDCLEEAIANRMIMKLDIPEPKRISAHQHSVSLSATLAAKAALYVVMKNKHLTNIALAKKLSCDEKEIRRLLDPHFQSKIPRIEDVLHVLGQRLEVNMTQL